MPRFPVPRFLLVFVSLLAAYCWWIEPARLTVSAHTVSDPDQPLDSPVRVLLLTDWHLGRWSRASVLAAKMERLRRLHQKKPFDMVLLGGDYIDTQAQYLERLRPALAVLRSLSVPLLAVLGNHDYTTYENNPAPVISLLEASGATVLRNESTAVTTAHGQRVLVVGLDDLQQSTAYFSDAGYKAPDEYRQAASHMDWYSAFDAVEPGLPRLLLAHNPDAVYLPGQAPRAVLSGHTHGGQMMLLDWVSRPLHRWIHPHLPPGSAVTWAGRKRVNGRTLLVSRGIEGSSIPLRLLRPPEAVVITFR